MKKHGHTSQGQSLADLAFERNLKPRPEVSFSAFSFLFSEIVQQLMKAEKHEPLAGIAHQQQNHDMPNDLEHQLFLLGVPVGEKVLELMHYREKGGQNGACQNGKRETKVVAMLHFLNNTVWKAFFGKQADGIEQSIEDENEYRILDKRPVTNRYTSMGKETNLNCASYIAGILQGIFTSARMPCRVTCHQYSEEGETQGNEEEGSSFIYVIKFAKEVAMREKNN